MNLEVKKCADANDIKGLRYIFVDCLDVDPTFDTYRDDYEYCKRISGFFDSYSEITPFKANASEWNEDYWVKLKVDLLKNFSEKRFMHMLDVVRVLKADKIKRLYDERSQAQTSSKSSARSESETKKAVSEERKKVSFDANMQQKEIEEAQRNIELENQRIQEEIDRKSREKAIKAERLKTENQQHNSAKKSSLSKKAMGIAMLLVLVVIVLVLILK